MPGCEAISSESSQATLNNTKSLRQQKSRIKKLLSPWRPDKAWRILPLTSLQVLHELNVLFSTNCFPNQLLRNENAHSLGRCMMLFIQAHTWILTPTYFCDSSYFFYLCNAMMVSKFVIKFKALPVIQVLASLKAKQRDLKFVFVIIVFPVKMIM